MLPPQEAHQFMAWKNLGELSSADAVSYNALSDPYPYHVLAWGGTTRQSWKPKEGEGSFSYYGFVCSGRAALVRILRRKKGKDEELRFELVQGMYFSCPGACRIEGGCGIIIRVPDDSGDQSRWSLFRPLFNIGGPIEVSEDNTEGRLPYIDGASDTLLLSPVVKGAPCLNHLHFPPNIQQTQHTHPTGRAGMIVRGKGQCVVVDPESGKKHITLLEAGTAFVIPKVAPHAFETCDGETLDVVAFHPDSDFGPSPKDHPMMNRTYVNGVSASNIPSIQTKYYRK